MNVGLWWEGGVLLSKSPHTLLPWVNINVFLTTWKIFSYLKVFIIIYLYFTLKVIYQVNARIARILLIKILIFDTGVRWRLQ